MSIDQLILDTEKALRLPLEKFFNGKYPEDHLVSHGLEHHRRVWGYAKELLIHTSAKEQIPDRLFVTKLIIACFLHDIGMASEKGERHGRLSRTICEEFLQNHSIKPADHQDTLHAIEHHDDKTFKGTPVENAILSILTAADDLDAFGSEGAERYLEIYRLRGIPENEIREKIISNARNRFLNFELNFRNYPSLVEIQKKRYYQLVSYLADNPS